MKLFFIFLLLVGLSVCEVDSCFGELANSTDVCNGNGNCTRMNYCLCDVGYRGDNCSMTTGGKCLDDGSVLYNGICYVDIGSGRSFDDSEAVCVSLEPELESHLVSILSADEENYVNFNIRGSNDIWIGLKKVDSAPYNPCPTPAGYEWTDGSDTTYAEMVSVDCDDIVLCIKWSDSLGWVDAACTNDSPGAICKYAVPSCFGYPSNDFEDACSGRGECIKENNCTCFGDYYGEDCSNFDCYEFQNDDIENVCSGHGTCDSPDFCSCDDNYLNDNCNVTTCDGIDSSESSQVCSGRGECVDFNTCACNDTQSYGGTYCELMKCFGVLENETSQVCSGNGNCTGVDECDCYDEYFGDACGYQSYFVCLRESQEGELGGAYSCDGSLGRPGKRSRTGGALFENSETLIIFGGYGYGGEENGTTGHLNDLWKFDMRTNNWCFIKGSNTTGSTDNQFGISSPFVFDSDHLPGSRSGYSYFATLFSFFIFGGESGGDYYYFDVSSENVNTTTNEMWELSFIPKPTQYYWRLLQSDSDEENSIPSRRTFSCSSKKWNNLNSLSNEMVYIFGGGGRKHGDDNFLFFSDLWEYDILHNTFNQLRSTDTNTEILDTNWNMTEFFESVEKGVMNSSLSFNPPGRTQHRCWVDVNDHFYIFSGTLKNLKSSNDVWRYNTTQNGGWEWIHGSNDCIEESVIVGDGHYYHDSNTPSSRSASLSFLDQNLEVVDGVLVFGGMNMLTRSAFSDMWAFSTSLEQWKFVNGSTLQNEKTDSFSIGARYSGFGVRKLDEEMIIFGGEG